MLKLKKILSIALIVVTSFLIVISSVEVLLADTSYGGFINTENGDISLNPSQYAEKYQGNISRATTIQGGFGAVMNFFVGFMGFTAILFLMYGGFIYMTSNGDQAKIDKGKKIVWQTIIAMMIIFGVYAVVNSLLNISAAINPNISIPLGPLELQSGPAGGTLQLTR